VQESPFMQVIGEICKKDPRYHPDAYVFTREALDYAVRMLKKPAKGAGRHVTARELLDGVRVFAIQEFGPMSLTVLESWGVTKTADFGEIVFHLVETGKLGKTEDDKKEDFGDVFDFYEAFAKPFLPRSALAEPGRAPRRRRRAAPTRSNVEQKKGEQRHG
jgi:uncharacterized repeat protein (TIGR04138 family)